MGLREIMANFRDLLQDKKHLKKQPKLETLKRPELLTVSSTKKLLKAT
jgi:hypothetical protein